MSMANAKIVYTGGDPNGESGTLFEGKKFWLSRNVPQRNRFKELIQINGGVIVLQDHQADIKLVDHLRRGLAPDTYSYQWVEESIKNGRLENLELYRAGRSAGTTRPVGASGVPTRRSKVPYTLEDDQILWDWLQPYEKQGAAVMGNKIYEMLEEKHPRHTFQSWRDRYLKKLRGQPRPGGPSSAAQQTPSRQEVDGRTGAEAASPRPAQVKKRSFARPATASYESRRRETDQSRTQNEDSESSDSQIPTATNHPTTPSRQISRASLMREGGTRSPQAQRSPSLHLQSPNVPDRAPRSPQAPSAAADSRDAAESSPRTKRDPRADTETSRNQGILKRKRQSTDAVSEIPRFDMDRRPDHKRRATDSIPKRIPSIQEEPRIKIEEEEENDVRVEETESDETDSEERFDTARQVQDTQDVPTAPQQDVDNLLMELPFPPSSPGSEDGDNETEGAGEGAEDAISDLDEWIDSRLRTGQAKDERQVIKALRCTSMDPDLADQVLSYLVAGKGIPQDMRGVWTPEDDKCLEGTDARDIDRLLKKHGTDLYNRRFEYLEMVRAEDYAN
ncbi:hypothetical protein VTN02DRAFT_5857 [Thermoascus thermophilus]